MSNKEEMTKEELRLYYIEKYGNWQYVPTKDGGTILRRVKNNEVRIPKDKSSE